MGYISISSPCGTGYQTIEDYWSKRMSRDHVILTYLFEIILDDSCYATETVCIWQPFCMSTLLWDDVLDNNDVSVSQWQAYVYFYGCRIDNFYVA